MLIFLALVSSSTFVYGRGSFAGSRPINSGNLNNRFLGESQPDNYFERTSRVYPASSLDDHIGFGDQGAVEGTGNLNQFTTETKGNLNQLIDPQLQRPSPNPNFIRPTSPPSTYQKTHQINNGYNSGYNRGYGGNFNKNWANRRQFGNQQGNHQGQHFGGPASSFGYGHQNYHGQGYQNKYAHRNPHQRGPVNNYHRRFSDDVDHEDEIIFKDDDY